MRSYSDLPEETIFDILSRLRAKSVGVCRCVSKSRRALLYRPHFIRIHLRRSRILRQESLILMSFSQGSISSAALSNARHLFDEITLSNKLGFREGKNFVSNPVTRDIRDVPFSPFDLDPYEMPHWYGLGYDSVSDDYKILRTSYNPPKINENRPEMFVDVYSLKTGSWKRAENSPYDLAVAREAPCVLLDGCIHWLACSTTKYAIVACNLEEMFHEVPPPSSVQSGELVYDNLSVLDGCLCMFNNIDDVWVMKEHDIVESWTKFTINGHHYYWLLCFLGQEQVVMRMIKSMKHVIYNLKEGTSRDIVIDGNSDE